MTTSGASTDGATRARVRIEIAGRVQGVGFRPFVARLAESHGLAGWVRNDAAGVSVEAEGAPGALESFLKSLRDGTPASGAVRPRQEWIAPRGDNAFEIVESEAGGVGGVFLPPDLAACAECLSEMRDPANRRYRYPFINCAHCGPRASIVARLPYDRERTTMTRFAMCSRCRAEYASREDRRFHAEAIACPECGPRLEWRTAQGERAEAGAALRRASDVLRSGGVIAVKGISGFHLMADAACEEAVRRLRGIKRRDAKPLAVMYPDLARLEIDARLTAAERSALGAAEAPIVLAERRADSGLAPSLATHNPLVGAMLAYAPLHHLLLEGVGGPLAATSANFGEEPIIIANEEAAEMFGALVDGALTHDRGIVQRADDSVARLVEGRARPIRVGRGFAPVCLEIPGHLEVARNRRVLAMGGHEKGAIALAVGGAIYLSRHLGDLETLAAREAYEEAVRGFLEFFDCRPDLIVCDMHPDYFSARVGRRLALEFGCESARVQHHAAHFFSLILEGAGGEDMGAMGLCFDGTGWGMDGSAWGAEWIAGDARAQGGWRRTATMAPIALAGGEACVREPWRVALALAHGAGMPMNEAMLREDRAGARPDGTARRNVEALLAGGRASVWASSMGRLFDGVASLLGLRHRAQFSAQPAMELEFAATAGRAHRNYELSIAQLNGLPALDWRPMIREAMEDERSGVDARAIAAAFHEAIARGCGRLARELGVGTALLTGGCFQNRLLTELVAAEMRRAGIQARMHARIPPNDGGLAAGQALAGLLQGNGKG